MMRRAALLLVGLALGVFSGVAWAQPGKVRIGLIEIEGALRERAGGLGALLGDESELTSRRLSARFNVAAANAELRGLVVRLKDAQLSASQVQELGRAMQRVRAAGKKIHLFAEGYGPTELVLGGCADDVMLQSGGEVSLPGMHMQEFFLADALAWLGIKADMVQVGDYKGASEMMSRNAPSPQWDQNINGLLDSLYACLRDDLKTGRKLSDDQLDRAMSRGWSADGELAKQLGLIDTVIDLPQLSEHLKAEYGAQEVSWATDGAGGRKPRFDPSNPFAFMSVLGQKPQSKPVRGSLAVLHIDGAIVDGESAGGGPFGGDSSVGSRTVRKALREIEEEDLFKGMVIRINSPGGSAIASEVIWQGVRRVAAKKPVWVSVGSMAASGGYYIAAAGDRIYVNPSSIVGSIGVVGGKIAMGGLLDKLGIRVKERSRGPRANLLSMLTPWDEAQRELVRAKMKETYDLFTSRVVAGRKGIDLSKTAEGRLFAGREAIVLRMADSIGGLDEALADMAREAGLASGSYDVMDFPAPMTLEETLSEMMGRFGLGVRAPGPRATALTVGAEALRETVGERAWPSVRDAAHAMMQLRDEHVLLVSPSTIIVR